MSVQHHPARRVQLDDLDRVVRVDAGLLGIERRARRNVAQIVAGAADRRVGEALGLRRRRRLRIDVHNRAVLRRLDLQAVRLACEQELPRSRLAAGLGQRVDHLHADGSHGRDLRRRHMRTPADVLPNNLARHQVREHVRPRADPIEVGPFGRAVRDAGTLEIDHHMRAGARALQTAPLQLRRKSADPRDGGARADKRDEQAGRDQQRGEAPRADRARQWPRAHAGSGP